MFLKKIGSEE